MDTNLWQCTLMATLQCCPTGKPDCQHHDPLSHSVMLSWHGVNQSLPYPIYAERQARSSVNLKNHWFDSAVIRSRDLPHGTPVLYCVAKASSLMTHLELLHLEPAVCERVRCSDGPFGQHTHQGKGCLAARPEDRQTWQLMKWQQQRLQHLCKMWRFLMSNGMAAWSFVGIFFVD